MKLPVRSLILALGMICLEGCAHGAKQAAPAPAQPSKLQGQSERFTGRVVLVTAGYRLKLTESEELVRLTRAKKRSELATEEINLKKYYEKTLAFRGRREGEWIWGAEVLGQWLRPGEQRGSNLTAPDVGPRQ
jgi:hypothetical protein